MKRIVALIALLVIPSMAIAQDQGEINKKETYQNLVLYPSIGLNTRQLTHVHVNVLQLRTYLNKTKVILTIEKTWESGLHETEDIEVMLDAGTDYYNENVIEGQVY